MAGDAKEPDGDGTSGWRTHIARQPLLPAEPRVRPLRTGENYLPTGRRSDSRRRQAHFHALMSHQLLTGAPMDSAAPIVPEQRSRTHLQRMEQYTDLPRLCRCLAVPLTLLTERAGPTTAHAGPIDYAQTAIGFSAMLMGEQFLLSRATQRSIRLESKVLPPEAARFPGAIRGYIRPRQFSPLLAASPASSRECTVSSCLVGHLPSPMASDPLDT